jgi:hypothetical protein
MLPAKEKGVRRGSRKALIYWLIVFSGFLLIALIFFGGLPDFSGFNGFRTFPGISAEEASKILPGPPGRVEVERDGTALVLRWPGPRFDEGNTYQVYRRCDHGWWRGWRRVSQLPGRENNAAGTYEFRDPENKADCDYSVSVIDGFGTEGPRSVSVRYSSQ